MDARPEPGEKPRETTVKCCLKKAFIGGQRTGDIGPGGRAPLCGSRVTDAIMDVINDTVLYVSKVARRGSLVVLLTVLKTLEAGGGRLPDDFFGGSFFAQCFKYGHLKPRKTKDVVVWEEDIPKLQTSNKYIVAALSDEAVRGALKQQQLKRLDGDSNLIVAAANEYETGFSNFFDYELPRRIKTYVNALWSKQYHSVGPERSVGAKGQKSVALTFVTDLWRDVAVEPQVEGELLAALRELRAKHLAVLGDRSHESTSLRGLEERLKRLTEEKRANKSDTIEMAAIEKQRVDLAAQRKRIKALVPLRRIEFVFWILCKLEALGSEHKRFAMAPVSQAQRKHVRIDGSVFRDYLFPRLKEIGYFRPDMTKEALDDPDLLKAHLAALFPGARSLRSSDMG
jgi:hypothetical protein